MVGFKYFMKIDKAIVLHQPELCRVATKGHTDFYDLNEQESFSLIVSQL